MNKEKLADVVPGINFPNTNSDMVRRFFIIANYDIYPEAISYVSLHFGPPRRRFERTHSQYDDDGRTTKASKTFSRIEMMTISKRSLGRISFIGELEVDEELLFVHVLWVARL